MLYVNGDVENTSGAAGESAGLIHEQKSVQQIVHETIAGFWREIDRLATLCGRACRVEATIPVELQHQPGEDDHQIGSCAGKGLKGVERAELPVMQSTKFELSSTLELPASSSPYAAGS